MSTKIYDGFKLKDIRSLDKAFHAVRDMAEPIKEAAKQQCIRFLIDAATFHYDRATVIGESLQGRSAYGTARTGIDDILMESAKQRRRCSYNVGFSVAVAPVGKCVIGTIFTDNRTLKKLFFEHPLIEEYGYWNNTDRPDHVTGRQWATRRGHWNQVLEHGYPGEEMFNITFVQDYQFPWLDRDDLRHYITDFDKRLQRIVEEVTMAKASVELNLDSPGKVIQYRMNSNDYTTRFEAEKLLLQEKFKQDLKLEDLLEKL